VSIVPSKQTSENLRDLGLLVLRLGLAVPLLWLHGWGKLMSFEERADRFADPIGLGPMPSLALITFAEVFCSALVALGLFTRWAAIPPAIGLAVAFFVQHGGDPFRERELAFVYMIGFAAVALLGGGRFALERVRRKGKR
jgi:putative oxidoreductase